MTRRSPGDEPREEELVHADAADVPVDDHRKARREEKPEAPRRGEKTQRELLRVPFLEKRGEEKPSHRDDRYTGGAGERGEDRARDQGDHGETAREKRVRQTHQAVGSAAVREEVPGKREERYRDEERRARERVHRHAHRRDVDPPVLNDEERQARRSAAKSGIPKRMKSAIIRTISTTMSDHSDVPGAPRSNRVYGPPGLIVALPIDRLNIRRADGVEKTPVRDQKKRRGEYRLEHPRLDVQEFLFSVRFLFEHEPERGKSQKRRRRGGGEIHDPVADRSSPFSGGTA